MVIYTLVNIHSLVLNMGHLELFIEQLALLFTYCYPLVNIHIARLMMGILWEYQRDRPSGKLSHFAIEHGPFRIYPSKMVISYTHVNFYQKALLLSLLLLVLYIGALFFYECYIIVIIMLA